jgi:actin
MRSLLSVKSPVDENGLISNWDDMEKVWDYIFTEELKISPDEHPILITEPPGNPKGNRERIAQIMFENYNIQKFYLYLTSTLALFSTGRSSGCVLDSGETNTTIVPIYEYYHFPHAISRIEIGGKQLNQHLKELLWEKGYFFSNHSELQQVKEMKEKMTFVAYDYEKEIKKFKQPTPTAATAARASKSTFSSFSSLTSFSSSATTNSASSAASIASAAASIMKSYKLPDGHEVMLGSERFVCPEAFFQPSLVRSLMVKGYPGIHEAIYGSIMKCDEDIRKELFSNIVLAGGSTLFAGISERLTKELVSLVPSSSSYKVKVIAPQDRRNSVWIGGSMVAALSTFKTMWVSKAEYDETGPSIIHSKCV